MEDLAVVVLVGVVAVAEAVAGEGGAHVGAHNGFSAVGQLIERALELDGSFCFLLSRRQARESLKRVTRCRAKAA